MSNDFLPAREPDSEAEDVSTTPPDSGPRSWVSLLAVVACITIFLGLTVQDNYDSWEALAKFGYLPADSVWKGGYWALVTSAFVHFTFWHVTFNVCWLWVLGSRLERAIGSLPFLAFVVVSAWVSSSFQLAVSDTTGIGASGVVYAIFGFMWPTRNRYPQFNDVLNTQTIRIFLIWMAGCVVATYLDIWNVGNAAHISGLLFGGIVAGTFAVRFKPRLMFAGLVAMVAFSIIPLFWCPWSVTWLSNKAFNAHLARRYDVAVDRYTQIIRIDPDNAWAYLNRSYVYQALGQPEEARTDLEKALGIDPSIGKGQ